MLTAYQMWFWTLTMLCFLAKLEGWVKAGWWVVALPLLTLGLTCVLEAAVERWDKKP